MQINVSLNKFQCGCVTSFTSIVNAESMKFLIKEFFSKYDQIWILSHLLQKSLMEKLFKIFISRIYLFVYCKANIYNLAIKSINEISQEEKP